MAEAKFLTAREAAQRLGISTATLYSYVSRGLVRSESAGGKSRARRYYADDVRKLQQRQAVRYNPEKVAEMALSWGAPILDSEITLIQNGQLFYRGHNALSLARASSFEEIASLLWTGGFEEAQRLFKSARLHAPSPQIQLAPIERFQTVLAEAAGSDLAAYDYSADAVAQTGARILALLTQSAVAGDFQNSIAETLQTSWLPEQPKSRRLIEAALILCADHELNVSAFTARCVASARATPYEAVIAGLAALSGYRHGGSAERVNAFFRDAEQDVMSTLRRYLQTGQQLPGIGHRLYPKGDPRATLLLEMVAEQYGKSAGYQLAKKLGDTIHTYFEYFPNVDFALVTLTRALELPNDAPLILFAIGRTAGWIGHVIEQYQVDDLIRPRARYTGVKPLSDSAGDDQSDS